MNETHTPAPWEVKTWKVPDGYGIVRADVIAPQREGYIVAVMDPVWRDGSARIGVTNLAMSQEEYTANATLIAAAPDLLAVVKRMMAAHRGQLPSEAADLYGGGCGCPLCEEGRTAIAKAKGEQP